MTTFSFRTLGLAALAALGAGPAAAQLRADGPPVRLLADEAPALRPVWSPDGARLAFTRDGYTGLWTVEADGADVRQLSDAPAAGFGFAWAPDGRAIAARAARLDGIRRLDAIRVFALDGTSETLVEAQATAPSLPVWLDAWRVGVTVDGILDIRPAAEAPRLAPLAGETVVGAGPDGLQVADLGANAVRTVAPVEGRMLNLAVAPDGRRVAFEVMGGNAFVADLDGSGAVDLGPGHRPAWSPDGQYVALQVSEDDGHDFTASEIVAVRADGSERVALTATPGRLEMNPSWSPDGRTIAFDADGALYLLSVTEDPR